MFVVTVQFHINDGKESAFLEAMREQAHNSVQRESGCHQFDVCQNADGVVFLYEVYADEAAFKAHLASSHYAAFDQKVASWVRTKAVSKWALLEHAQ